MCQQKQKTMCQTNNTTAQLVEIPLTKIQSPNYDANIDKYCEDVNTCVICGKRIKNMDKIKYVHYLTNGNIINTNDEPENTQGFFPVGNDCAKKIDKSFLFKFND